MSYVTHLEAAIDGTRLPHDELQTLHEGRPLWVRYDLEAVGAAMTPEAVAGRAPTMWRYRELLPVEDHSKVASLGEGMTPLLRCERLGAALGLNDLWVKDESQLPTGSFKSRGLAMAISRANELGVERVAIPTCGNAGGAMAAYAARVGMVSCQSDGCAPISTAWEAGERFAEPFPDAATSASGLRVPAAVGDFMIIDAVNESGGQARACPEQSLLSWARRGAALEGIAFTPEAGACLGVLELLVAEKAIHPDERVVVFNTGAAQKYVEVMGSDPLPRLPRPLDWATLSS